MKPRVYKRGTTWRFRIGGHTYGPYRSWAGAMAAALFAATHPEPTA